MCAHIDHRRFGYADVVPLLPEHTVAPKIGQSVQTECCGCRLHLHRLPSGPRAYPLALEKKAAAYRAVLEEIFRLPES
ncbi:hypothetical protein [Neisseria animalis]|uniref:hypothetical protein n=1 Tax=Neisseria animalis TaxID=492 RepID=UPI0039E53B18